MTPRTRSSGLPVALTDAQLEMVVSAAALLPVEKRILLLERTAASARLRIGPPNPCDLAIERA
jgi:hypothetical protein